jgi:hypothetical protein
MKQTITRLRVIEIVLGYEVLKQLSGVKMAYAIGKNITALKREHELIKESTPRNKDLEKYQEEYQVIIDSEAKKDDSGNFIPVGNGQVAISNYTSFKTKINDLEKKYATQLADQKEKDEEFERFLKEPFEFEFFQFDESLLPDSITVEQMELISEMIKME